MAHLVKCCGTDCEELVDLDSPDLRLWGDLFFCSVCDEKLMAEYVAYCNKEAAIKKG